MGPVAADGLHRAGAGEAPPAADQAVVGPAGAGLAVAAPALPPENLRPLGRGAAARGEAAAVWGNVDVPSGHFRRGGGTAEVGVGGGGAGGAGGQGQEQQQD